MSDMIDRLEAISAGAGRDVASDLTDPATIQVLAGRVRQGVRRRRIRAGAITGTALALVGAGALAAPTLLHRGLPYEPGSAPPGVVRTVGPITSYDDGSASIVLSSGQIINLPPSEGGPTLQVDSPKTLCDLPGPQALPASGWVSTSTEPGTVGDAVSLWVRDESGSLGPVLAGSVFHTATSDLHPVMEFRAQVDPAVAPFVAIKYSIVEFKVLDSGIGAPTYSTVVADTGVVGEPEPDYSGNADLGTRVGTVSTGAVSLAAAKPCYTYEDSQATGYWNGGFVWYAVAEIFAVDHMGAEHLLGTSGSWFREEVAAS